MSDVKMLKEELLKVKDDLLKYEPTLYCSAMAHLRGKLHMSKIHGSTFYCTTYGYCWNWYHGRGALDERRHIFEWTMEDQANMLRGLFLYLECRHRGEDAEKVLEEDIRGKSHFYIPKQEYLFMPRWMYMAQKFAGIGKYRP